MIELADSTTKMYANANTLPRISVLRNPFHHSEYKNPLGNDFDTLIAQNVIDKHRNDKTLALQIRAFVNSLSDDNRTRFLKVVKAFNLDPDKNLFVGEIWSGGGMKVIAGSGLGLAVTYLKLLAGMNLHTFLAASGGAFQGISRALDCIGSDNLNATIEAPFHSFHQSRETLESWTHALTKNAHTILTGQEADEVTGKHIREVGRTFDVIVAKPAGTGFRRSYVLPDAFFLFRECKERFGIHPDTLSVKKAIGYATNLPGLIHENGDPTYGEAFIDDNNGRRHHLVDPGLNPAYRAPIDFVIEQIERYRSGKTEKPEMFFIMDYPTASNSDIRNLKRTGGRMAQKRQTNTSFFVNSVINTIDHIAWGMGYDIASRAKKFGIGRTYLTANCAAIDPNTGEIKTIEAGGLTTTPETVRETIIGASIPLRDYKDVDNSVIDQLFRNFVDEEFISSNGKRGLSPYNLVLRDIDKAIGKNQNPESANGSYARSIWSTISSLRKAASF